MTAIYYRSVCPGRVPRAKNITIFLALVCGWKEYILVRAPNNPDTFIGTDLVIKMIAKMYLNIDGDRASLERTDA
tara:strand:+ start:839 stop:1063 length:225 start_codon:yes stop_codon:yes gene_type:complete